jgi:hypothetical protein
MGDVIENLVFHVEIWMHVPELDIIGPSWRKFGWL